MRKTSRRSGRIGDMTRGYTQHAGKTSARRRVRRSRVAYRTESRSAIRPARRSRTSGRSRRVGKFKRIVKKTVLITLMVGVVLMAILVVAGGMYLKQLENSLPSPDKLIDWKSDETTIIYDRNGTELFNLYNTGAGGQNRLFVKLDEIPLTTKWALLSAEDSGYYQHKGLDFAGIARCSTQAAIYQLSHGKKGTLCGASTISQQLVRNTIMYQVYGAEAYERDNLPKTARRKLREWLLTMEVEQNYDKDRLLQMYMNEVPLGGVNYGFEAAAKAYFGKDVKDLDLAESAILAGIIQSPSVYAPIVGTDPDAYKERQAYVLDQMDKHLDLINQDIRERGGQEITHEDIEAARHEDVQFAEYGSKLNIDAPHFVFYVVEQLEKKYGEDVSRQGLRVYTTLDLPTQKIAEEEIKTGIPKYGAKYGVKNGAMVVLDPNTNQILAMVGSIDYNNVDDPSVDGNVNVTTSKRQMGSSVKPYVYLTAIQKYGGYLTTPDIKLDLGSWNPQNWDGHKYMGPLNMRKALVESRNLPAIYTLQLVGKGPVIDNIRKFGITTYTDPDSYGLSMALGAVDMKLLEHAQGYSVFATGGIKRDVTPFLKITNSHGDVLYSYKQTDGERVVSEKDIYMLNWMLCDLNGFNDRPFNDRYYANGHKICGKTGTTNGPRDLVAMQYHKNLVAAVWAGNDDNVEVPGAWSTTVPLPIVNSFMNRVADKYKPETYGRPAGLVVGTVCQDTGRIPNADTDCKRVTAIWDAQRAPAHDTREEIYMCKGTDKISDNKDVAEKFDLIEPATWLKDFVLENAKQQPAYEKYMKKLKDKKIFFEEPEHMRCELPLGPANEPIVEIHQPEASVSFTAGQDMWVSAEAFANGDITKVEVAFGANIVKTFTEAPYEFTYTIPDSTGTGNYYVTVTAYDDQGRTGQNSVVVAVNNPNEKDINLSITNPSAFIITSLPLNITADVSGADAGEVTSVTFDVEGTGATSYSQSYTDTDGSDGWGISWGGVPDGSYHVKVSTTVAGRQYQSAWKDFVVTVIAPGP